ncbi:hypothetical protein AMEX_G19581 [Astyanax mexicanus]|uniref:Uncharacterized protein n=1 Tax=Astyanax mexicanus TaxID=7994 RepID=A0A8T2L5N7_ASTMX|nr:hypothetical protein AMEX_G19581 [Astyanax mexicanus]
MSTVLGQLLTVKGWTRTPVDLPNLKCWKNNNAHFTPPLPSCNGDVEAHFVQELLLKLPEFLLSLQRD